MSGSTRKEILKRRRTNDSRETIERHENFQHTLIVEGVCVGFLVGCVVSMFRYLFLSAEQLRTFVVNAASTSIAVALLAIFLLAFLLCINTLITIREPVAGSSGIPQVEAELKGQLNARWFNVTATKFAGGIISVFSGLSLGSEGPSVQLGAMIGKGFSRFNNRLRTEEKLLITCGSGAGLAAAFGAPLAGVMFTLEELHKNFSKEVLLTTMAAAITADCVASYIFGLTPVFSFEVESGFPLSDIWLIVIFGVILGAFGVFYNNTTLFSQDLFNNRFDFISQKLIIPFVMVVLLVIFMPEALGSGSSLIGEAGTGELGLKFLICLLVVKYISSAISFGTGHPGGTFLPILVLGALSGGIFADVAAMVTGADETYIQYFVILGMAGYFSAIVRAPITGIILISEMTGTFSNLLALSTVSLVSYMTAELLNGEPIYEQLTERLIFGKTIRNTHRKNKVLSETDVYFGSFMDGKPISEISLPKGCLVVSIARDGREIIPGGSTVIKAGDVLTVICNDGIVMEVQDELGRKCRTVLRS